MSDNEWAKRYQEFVYVKALEYKNLSKIIELATKKSLAEILSQVFK